MAPPHVNYFELKHHLHWHFGEALDVLQVNITCIGYKLEESTHDHRLAMRKVEGISNSKDEDKQGIKLNSIELPIAKKSCLTLEIFKSKS